MNDCGQLYLIVNALAFHRLNCRINPLYRYGKEEADQNWLPL